jgi:hypothetical protein
VIPSPASDTTGQADLLALTYTQFTLAVTTSGFPAPSESIYAPFAKGVTDFSDRTEAAMFLANLLQVRFYACDSY